MSLIKITIIIGFLLLLILCCKKPDQHGVTNSMDLEKIVNGIVQPNIDSGSAVGIGVGIMKGDSIILEKAYGYADLEFDIPLPIEASFQIGSITKQFTAVSVLQLSENGRIDLDENVEKYLPTLNNAEPITIRQLLTHTSGIKNHQSAAGFKALLPTKAGRDTLLYMLSNEANDFLPGSMMIYSNTGYFLLGLVVEKVTGQPYEEYVTKNLFAKAGMNNSYFCDSETIRKFRAHGYNFVDGGKYRAEEPYFHWHFGAGGICSTISDLLKWNHALHQTNTILNKQSYEELITPARLENGVPLRYALGLKIYSINGEPVVAHGGSGSGMLAEVRYFPKSQITIVTLENTYRRNNWFNVSDQIVNTMFPMKNDDQINYEGDLSVFEGTYSGPMRISIKAAGSDLMANRNGPTFQDTLIFKNKNTWLLGEEQYTFVAQEDHFDLNVDMMYANFMLKGTPTD